jgi:hypothetical protein
MMQKRVVYFLGAGFSAPLGPPVMSEFLDKSKELYRVNPTKFDYFTRVFSEIGKIHATMKYFKTDPNNIEEILSIIEMRTQLGGDSLIDTFRDYIADVIISSTREFTLRTPDPARPSDWDNHIFGPEDDVWSDYARFVASLHNLAFSHHHKGGEPPIRWERVSDPQTRYDVISLNYDRVLETVCESFENEYKGETPLHFQREPDTSAGEPASPWLVKLHGSVDSREDITPPTWSKALTKSVEGQWKVAYHLLAEANHIRVLGYSLPTLDTNVQYLLKSAVVRAEHESFGPLQSFHVITKDPDGRAKERYQNLFRFRGFQLVDASIEKIYLRHIKTPKQAIEGPVCCTTLEEAHGEFMRLAGRCDWKIPDDVRFHPSEVLTYV